MGGKIPSNSWEQTEFELDERGIFKVYLLDGNIVDAFEQIYDVTGVDLLAEIEKEAGRTFMFTNEVVVELLNRPQSIDMKLVMGHVLNTSGTGALKENRFLIKEEGETKVAYGSLVSGEDWGQVMACSAHDRLILVTNDVKLSRNALRALGEERTKTIHSLVKELLDADPDNLALQNAYKLVDHPSRKRLKIRKGEVLKWEEPPQA